MTRRRIFGHLRSEEGFAVLLLGMIVLGLATFWVMYEFIRFCDWV